MTSVIRQAASYRFRVLLVILAFVYCAKCQGCYDIEGAVIQGDIPCHPHLGHSFCCGIEWTCLSNGICSDSNTTDVAINADLGPQFYTATCTDPSWSSDECPRLCLDSDNKHSGLSPLLSVDCRLLSIQEMTTIGYTPLTRQLISCDNKYSSFCCGSAPCDNNGNTCSRNETGIFSLSEDSIPFTTVSSSIVVQTVTVGLKAASSSPSDASAPTTSHAATPTGAATTASGAGTHKSSRSATNIGLAVGVSAGMIILAFGLYISCRKIRRLSGSKGKDANAQPWFCHHGPYKTQDYHKDLSRIGYPPAELHHADDQSRAEMAGTTSWPRRRGELPTGVEILQELAEPSSSPGNVRSCQNS